MIDATYMKKRIIELLSPFSCLKRQALADALGISTRTVTKLVAEINEEFGGCIEISPNGYRLLAGNMPQYAPNAEAVPATHRARKDSILECLLFKRRTVTVAQLASELCVSEATVQNDIAQIRRELAPHELYIKIKRDQIFIIGPNANQKKYMLSYLNERLAQGNFNLSHIQASFSIVDLHWIKKTVLRILKSHELFLDDFSLLNYCLHLAICIETSAARKSTASIYAKQVHMTLSPSTAQLEDALKEIYAALREMYDVPFQLTDIEASSLQMLTRVRPEWLNDTPTDQIYQLVGPDIVDLLNAIILALQDVYGISLLPSQFLTSFAFHLLNVQHRMEHDIPIVEDQYHSVKNLYPLFYDIAIFIANIIQNKLGKPLPANEIDYIALHVGVMLEHLNVSTQKINCIILASNYNSINQMLYKKISRAFEKELYVMAVAPYFEETSTLEYPDLILSTENLEIKNPAIPCIRISPFMGKEDFARISEAIDELSVTKTTHRLVSQLRFFLREDLCFFNCSFYDRTAAIEAMCGYMQEKGYVSSDYKSQIYEHENLASSAYGIYAIPHPMSNSDRPSVIALAVSPKPIPWGENNVNIVFMLSLRRNDRAIFADIINFIDRTLQNKEVLKKLLTVQNYTELMNALLGIA